MVVSMKIISVVLSNNGVKLFICATKQYLDIFHTYRHIVFIFSILIFLVLFLFLSFQVLGRAMVIAIRINVNRNVTLMAIIIIRSGITAVVIIIVT